MKQHNIPKFILTLCMLFTVGCTNNYPWDVHDMDRPVPPVVTASVDNSRPPANAIILFDGTNASQWQSCKNGGPVQWTVENGYLQVKPKSGNIQTKTGFGDCQLHIEWATPLQVEGEGQHRGNSGVFLMGLYEVQVLDSYRNRTYADGQAGAIYGQKPPLFNVCRKPGQWQTYDIVFRRPRFDKNGKLTEKARMTVIQNGVVVQNNAILEGPTVHKKRPKYKYHPDRLPIMLQDHSDLVRYKNIWLIELPPE